MTLLLVKLLNQAVVALPNMNTSTAQKAIIDSYFSHLQNVGYLNNKSTSQVLLTILLLDTFNTFKEFITNEYIMDVSVILKKFDCCNCIINLT